MRDVPVAQAGHIDRDSRTTRGSATSGRVAILRWMIMKAQVCGIDIMAWEGCMRTVILAALATIALGCGPRTDQAGSAKAVHTASAKDTAFVRANCAMPDSVLAGSKPCIDRAQSSNVRVF